jgi:hypothetical protein
MSRIALILLGLLLAAPASAAILAQWVQLGPDTSASVRVITDGACPSVQFDGAAVPMAVRAEPNAALADLKTRASSPFPRSCEIAVPVGARAAAVEGKPLKLPRPDPQRIITFGDTGCRLKGKEIQDCNDPAAWPFPAIVAQAAAQHPDLVIDVGDYHYREDACPADRAGCAGSPSGYGWAPWDADFFTPAAPLLAAAPWVMARGNHEDCARAGEGWFRFLDRAPMPASCRDLTGVFVSRLGNFAIVNVDSAAADDPKKENADALTVRLHDQFQDVAAKLPAEAWLVTHRPLDAMLGVKGRNVVGNKVLEAAFGTDLPPAIHMLVSGHIHFFQAVDFGALHAPQLVVGTGGDDLDPMPPTSVTGTTINQLLVASATTESDFGYMLWERQGSAWSGTLFDGNGATRQVCRLEGRSLACEPLTNRSHPD